MIDAAAAFVHFVRNNKYDVESSFNHNCVVKKSSKIKGYVPSHLEISGLARAGCNVNEIVVHAFKIAHIMGVHFSAGEWGSFPRCGSVVTCVINRRSVYGRVSRFLRVEGDVCPGYAVVDWFGAPTYPFAHPLVVKVEDDGSRLDREIGKVVRVGQIDPSSVVVLPHGDHYFMLRQSGYDTVRA